MSVHKGYSYRLHLLKEGGSLAPHPRQDFGQIEARAAELKAHAYVNATGRPGERFAFIAVEHVEIRNTREILTAPERSLSPSLQPLPDEGERK